CQHLPSPKDRNSVPAFISRTLLSPARAPWEMTALGKPSCFGSAKSSTMPLARLLEMTQLAENSPTPSTRISTAHKPAMVSEFQNLLLTAAAAPSPGGSAQSSHRNTLITIGSIV